MDAPQVDEQKLPDPPDGLYECELVTVQLHLEGGIKELLMIFKAKEVPEGHHDHVYYRLPL